MPYMTVKVADVKANDEFHGPVDGKLYWTAKDDAVPENATEPHISVHVVFIDGGDGFRTFDTDQDIRIWRNQ